MDELIKFGIIKDNQINSNARLIVDKNPHLKQIIEKLTPFITEDFVSSLSERLYCLKNKIQPPLCLTCKVVTTKRQKSTRKYAKYCSRKCARGDSATQAKMVTTNNQRYGVDNPFQSTDVKNKIQQTNLRKYGVGRACQSVEVKAKIKETFERKYGGHPLQTHQIREQIKQTNLRKYGVAHSAQSPTVKDKKDQTMLDRYGCVYPRQVNIPESVFTRLNDKQWVYDQHVIRQSPLLQIANTLGVSVTMVKTYLKKHNIEHQYYYQSIAETEIYNFLVSNVDCVVSGDRRIIAPRELDIVLPDKKIAIEYCGLYWHADIHTRIDSNYHLQKLLDCNAKGYRLITIFEDEWIQRPDQVKRTLLALCGPSSSATFARKCRVAPLSSVDKKLFFDRFHLQRNGRGSISYGLYTNSQRLVAAVTFIVQQNGCYTLNRFATSERVVGGFGKLLAHFKKHNVWNSIVTFADRRWSEGNLYEATGFTLDKILPPDYSYIIGQKRFHKFNFRHEHLKRLLGDSYDQTLSESENTANNNILRIWNCGLKRYICNR